MKILITGATGFIGKQLVLNLFKQNHNLVILSRNAESARKKINLPCEFYDWDLMNDKAPIEAFKDVDTIIHLAGESVAEGRWTKSKKDKILNSRVLGTKHLVETLKSLKTKPKLLLSASAIGIYGNRGDEELHECSIPDTTFLANVCKAWEDESQKAKDYVERIVNYRIGIVLGQGGGALDKMITPFKMGVGGTLGNGKQWMSWIHIDDIIGLMNHVINTPDIHGAINAVSPTPKTNKGFTKILGKVLNRPTIFPVPSPVLKLVFGEMSEILLASQRVLPKVALKHGYNFQFSNLEEALVDILKKKTNEVVDEFFSYQFIPHKVDEVFRFFSEAKNLETITPPWLNFKVVNKTTENLQEDTKINYKLKVHGIPLKWQSVISEWHPNQKFVDWQSKGPYKKWHHTHEFFPVKNGTVMTDRVLYKVPMGELGKIASFNLVKKDIEKIFSYRTQQIEKMYEK